MKTRRGASLAELLVIMTACSVILTMSVVLMHRMLRVQSASREFFAQQRSAMRLSEQFRADAHQAESAVTSEDKLPAGAFLQLHLKNGQLIEYSEESGTVRRTVREEEASIARDEFVFHPQINVHAERDEASPLLSLTITGNGATSEGEASAQSRMELPVKLHFQAHLGRDSRLSQSLAQEGQP